MAKERKKAPTLAGTRRQAAALQTAHEKSVLKRLTALEKQCTGLERRVTSLTGQNKRLRQQVIKLRENQKMRKRKRYVGHRISRAEKAHLLEIWLDHKHDEARLKKEGRKLAKRYSLHFDRQVMRWFGFFAKMVHTERHKIAKDRQK